MIDKYIDYLKNIKQYSPHTINAYYKDITKYMVFLKENNIDYKQVNYKQLQTYLSTIISLERSSIIRNISSLRNFYKYLVNNKVLDHNVINLLEVKNNKRRLPNFNTYDVTNKTLDSIPENSELNIRDKLIIELLYSTGIRVSELVNIKDSDVDFSSKIIKILGKGQKERIVVYGNVCHELLELYLKLTIKCNSNSPYLIINAKGDKITTRSINNIIYKHTPSDKKMSAHTFRHSYATDMLDSGADLKTVQTLLGHSNISTTSIYTHTSKEKIRNDYLRAHPRNK